MDNQAEQLFQAYWAGKSIKSRNAIVVFYGALAKKETRRIHSKLPNSVDISDIEQDAMIGLMQAVETYTPDRKTKFETWARYRIVGSVLDQLRKTDHLSKYVRKNLKKLDESKQMLEEECSRIGYSRKVREKAGIKDVTWNNLKHKVGSTIMDFASVDRYSDAHVAEYAYVDSPRKLDVIDWLKLRMAHLPSRDQLFVRLYYIEGLNQKEASEALGFHESRMSQVHKEILNFFRNSITEEQLVKNLF